MTAVCLLAAIALTGLACVAAAIWSGQLPVLRVRPADVPLDPKPKQPAYTRATAFWDDLEAFHIARHAAMTRADAAAGHLDRTVPAARKES